MQKLETTFGYVKNDDNRTVIRVHVVEDGSPVAAFDVENHKQVKALLPIIERNLEKLQDAPRPVVDVALAWALNAHIACLESIEYEYHSQTDADAVDTLEFWAGRLHIGYTENRWVIGDNYEKCASLVYYVEKDNWFYMSMYGEKRQIKGGTQEARANARIIWTG